MPSARSTALAVLASSQTIQASLDLALKANPLSPADVALATELVYGVLRTEIRLNYLLGILLRDPSRLPPALRQLLTLAAYELLHLDRVPAHATVHSAVELARRRFGPRLAGLVNGVLRRLPELGEAATSPDFFTQREADPAAALALRTSLPLWIVRLWREAYGEERAEALALASGRVPWTGLRINAARADAEAVQRELVAAGGVPVTPFGLAFAVGTQDKELRARLRQLVNEGRLSRQGLSSQRALEALGLPAWDTPFWDACAGRGGKTLALMERGVPVAAASDVHLGRLRGLRDDATRLGLPVPPCFLASASVPPLRRPGPARVILDVPCSGLGTLSRRPDLRRHFTPDKVPHLCAVQGQILESVWSLLSPGGELAYITCTRNPAENEQRIAAHCAAHADAILLKAWENTPDDSGADNMYAALLRKKG